MSITSAEYLKLLKQAIAYRRAKNYVSALEILDYLHQKAPERYAPLFLKALCHFNLDQVYDCEQAYQKCLAEHPNRVNVRYCYALFLATLGYFRDSITQFHQCITDGHDTHDLHFHLAGAYFQLDNFESARKHFLISLRRRLTWDGVVMLFKVYEILFLRKIFGE
ncbi:MAG: tetratricopeptide repeat protein [Armatimonas sp.]